MTFRNFLGAALAALALTTASAATAQTAEDRAAAEALFDDGKTLFLAKRFAEACPKLEGSQRLDPGIGTLLYLADCYEGLGRVASAWATFREAAASAKAAGQGERERVARSRAARLEPQLHRLTLNVATPGVPGLKITRHDAEMKRETWGAALPVDPGTHTITATAPGKKPWSTTVTIPEGPGGDTLAVPALEDAPAPPPVAGPTPPPAAPVAPPVPPPPPPRDPGPQRIAWMVIGGVGVAALGTGLGFGAGALVNNNRAKTVCPDVACGNTAGIAASKRAGVMADASTGLVIGGGVALATALVLMLTTPKASSGEKRTGWITPAFDGTYAGLAAGRAW